MEASKNNFCTLIQYNEQNYSSQEELLPEKAAELLDAKSVNWIDIETCGLEEINEFSRHFNIHPLIIGDITDTEQLPKFEVFDKFLFFSTKMLVYDEDREHLQEEHLSILMSDNLVITIQEGLPGDVFSLLRNRIEHGKGMIRKCKADFLFYHILNAVIDSYLGIMEKFRAKIENLEEQMLASTRVNVLSSVINLKQEINTLRMYTLPMREALIKMRVEGMGFIQKSSINYFQDLHDHLQYLITTFDTSREMLKDLMDLHQSNQNMEMNLIMKTLTVISAIFIPLTFIAGVYGMNFKYMPELEAHWGYLYAIAAMILVSIAMAAYMRYKRWF